MVGTVPPKDNGAIPPRTTDAEASILKYDKEEALEIIKRMERNKDRQIVGAPGGEYIRQQLGANR